MTLCGVLFCFVSPTKKVPDTTLAKWVSQVTELDRNHKKGPGGGHFPFLQTSAWCKWFKKYHTKGATFYFASGITDPLGEKQCLYDLQKACEPLRSYKLCFTISVCSFSNKRILIPQSVSAPGTGVTLKYGHINNQRSFQVILKTLWRCPTDL